MKNIKQYIRIVALGALAVLAFFVSGARANAATSVVNFDPSSGSLLVTGSCSGRYVLIVIKKTSDGSIWGSSNPPCIAGSYSYSLAVPDGVRTGAAFAVTAMDNGTPGTSGNPNQPVIFAPAPGIDQTATSAPTDDLSITIDTSSLAVDSNSTSFLDGVLQDCFGVVTSALNAAESSVVAAVQMFAKFFTIIPGGSITVPRGQNQISGQGSLAAGASEVFIANTIVTSSSQIIVTPTSPSQLPLSVVQITDGDGFDVGTISPQQIAVSFNWLIVDTYNAGPPTQAGLQQQGSQIAPAFVSSVSGSSSSDDTSATTTDASDDSSSSVDVASRTTSLATTTDDLASTTDAVVSETTTTTDALDTSDATANTTSTAAAATTTDATNTTQ